MQNLLAPLKVRIAPAHRSEKSSGQLFYIIPYSCADLIIRKPFNLILSNVRKSGSHSHLRCYGL